MDTRPLATRALLDRAAAANIWLFKDRATGIWVIRDRAAHRDLAHESNRQDGFKALRRIIEVRA